MYFDLSFSQKYVAFYLEWEVNLLLRLTGSIEKNLYLIAIRGCVFFFFFSVWTLAAFNTFLLIIIFITIIVTVFLSFLLLFLVHVMDRIVFDLSRRCKIRKRNRACISSENRNHGHAIYTNKLIVMILLVSVRRGNQKFSSIFHNEQISVTWLHIGLALVISVLIGTRFKFRRKF